MKKELGIDNFHVEIHIDKDKSLEVRDLANNADKSVSQYGE